MNAPTAYRANDGAVTAEHAQGGSGNHWLPVVWNTAAGVRQLYDAMAPSATDSIERRVAKEVFRWTSAVAGAAAVAVMVL